MKRNPKQTKPSSTEGKDEPKSPRYLSGLELAVFAILVVLLLACHFELMRHAGGLWRDEVHSANTAAMPSLARLWGSLWYESFPVFSLLVFRLWMKIFSPDNDFLLRVLGMMIGVGFCGVLIFNLRRAGRSFPFFSVALFCLNEITLRYGNSVRGYGLGCLLMLIAFYCFWRTATTPNPRIVLLTTLVSLLAAHTLYQNAFFIAGMCAGGVGINIRTRNWRRILILIGIGFLTALTLSIYFPGMARQQTIKMLSQEDLNWGVIWRALSETLNGGGKWCFLCWKILPVVALAAGVAALIWRRTKISSIEQDLLVYSIATTVVSLAGFVVFLFVLKFPTQSWYYLLPLALIACFTDVISAVLVRTNRLKIIRSVVALALAGSAIPIVWPSIQLRQTNIDGIARYVSQQASAQDLVLTIPWFYGITFARYYHGQASWSSVPPQEDLTLTRYDLLKQNMMNERAIAPVLDSVKRALESGHRVWLVGSPEFLPPGQFPPPLRPAPAYDWGWNCAPYLSAWSQNLTTFLQQHALKAQVVPVPENSNANRFENIPLISVEGWHSN